MYKQHAYKDNMVKHIGECKTQKKIGFKFKNADLETMEAYETKSFHYIKL